VVAARPRPQQGQHLLLPLLDDGNGGMASPGGEGVEGGASEGAEWQVGGGPRLRWRRRRVAEPAGVACARVDSKAPPLEEVWLEDLAPHGLRVLVGSVGCCLQRVLAADAAGAHADVVLGYESVTQYLPGQGQRPNYGSTVGRYANRVKEARFSLDGVEYRVGANNGRHALHGGEGGLYGRRFRVERLVAGPGAVSVLLSYDSPDGEEGYPGAVRFSTAYTVTSGGALGMEMCAQLLPGQRHRKTVVSLLNHAFWNLGGHSSGPVLGHWLRVNADRYTPVDSELIVTGAKLPVEGSPLDLRVPRELRAVVAELPLDHNFCLRAHGCDQQLEWEHADGADRSRLPLAAWLALPGRRAMTVFSNMPGLQVYTGGFIDANRPAWWRGKGGALYDKHHAICLEAQLWPDAVNNLDNGFPSPVLLEGELHRNLVVHVFSPFPAL
jgi:aldose 1-epimerase